MQGFINVFKPTGMTSAKVVSKIKHTFNIKKIGHMGTLDPLACGILPIAIGKATRMFDYFLDKTKTYITTFKFGANSNTLDLDGEVEYNVGLVPTKQQIIDILPQFVGNISQIPPQFSAKNINGQKAYKLARNGEQVDLKPKDITINKFELLEMVDDDSYKFEITCSSGTYIRSLARDIAEKLNTTAIVTYLERTQSGIFNKDNCVDLNSLLCDENVDKYIIKIQDVFPQFNSISISDENCTRLKNGLKVFVDIKNETNVFVFNNKELICVGDIVNNLLTIKTFLLKD